MTQKMKSVYIEASSMEALNDKINEAISEFDNPEVNFPFEIHKDYNHFSTIFVVYYNEMRSEPEIGASISFENTNFKAYYNKKENFFEDASISFAVKDFPFPDYMGAGIQIAWGVNQQWFGLYVNEEIEGFKFISLSGEKEFFFNLADDHQKEQVRDFFDFHLA